MPGLTFWVEEEECTKKQRRGWLCRRKNRTGRVTASRKPNMTLTGWNRVANHPVNTGISGEWISLIHPGRRGSLMALDHRVGRSICSVFRRLGGAEASGSGTLHCSPIPANLSRIGSYWTQRIRFGVSAVRGKPPPNCIPHAPHRYSPIHDGGCSPPVPRVFPKNSDRGHCCEMLWHSGFWKLGISLPSSIVLPNKMDSGLHPSLSGFVTEICGGVSGSLPGALIVEEAGKQLPGLCLAQVGPTMWNISQVRRHSRDAKSTYKSRNRADPRNVVLKSQKRETSKWVLIQFCHHSVLFSLTAFRAAAILKETKKPEKYLISKI